MFEAVPTDELVPFDGSFEVASAPTRPPAGAPAKGQAKRRLAACTDRLSQLQRRLYAEDRWAVLLVFQALDAAGKDGTIRGVLSGVNPAGVQVYSFQKPAAEELEHDFLWRTTLRLPERGRIGVFNRSYYEEVLVVRVHPEILELQRLPFDVGRERLWEQRFESIRDHERHLARNGTAILKFWLNVSKKEQARRLLERIDDPDRNWKFDADDLRERGFWDDYQQAYERALSATSRSWAPWYAIPADDKPYMRMRVAEILTAAVERLDPRYPEITAERRTELQGLRSRVAEDW